MRLLTSLSDLFRRLLGLSLPAVPREPVNLRPIGVVRNNVDQPRPSGWEQVRSDLVFRDDLLPALDGLDEYSHVIVVFYCHLVPEAERGALHVHLKDEPGLPEQGVLATRSQLRPSALGVAVVPLQRRRRNILRVSGLDAINGTPVLDVKPYIPRYDSVPDATLPPWASPPPSGG